MKALYAYFRTRPPVRATPPANTIPFPLNIRALQKGWKIVFFRNGRYQNDQSKSAEWNRGAYLTEGLSDCGGCHTPRNVLGAEKARDAYAGAVIEDWIAPALTEANPSPVPWTQDELFSYLRTGGRCPLPRQGNRALRTQQSKPACGEPITRGQGPANRDTLSSQLRSILRFAPNTGIWASTASLPPLLQHRPPHMPLRSDQPQVA